MLDFFNGVSFQQNKLILIVSSDDCRGSTRIFFFTPNQITALHSPNAVLEAFEVEDRREINFCSLHNDVSFFFFGKMMKEVDFEIFFLHKFA